jgi:presenilin-like A22 family membrane protease
LERSRQVGQDVCTAKQFLLVESIGFYAACAIDWDAGAFMSIGQAILFGMMLYWTPSVVLLAWLIWKERIGVKEV